MLESISQNGETLLNLKIIYPIHARNIDIKITKYQIVSHRIE